MWKHRICRRRTWRKLHLGSDERTKEIVAVEITESRVHDSQQLPSLLEQISAPFAKCRAMGRTTRERAMKRCSGGVRHRSSCLGVRPGRAPLGIPSDGELHVTVYSSKLPPRDAQPGGH